MVRQGMQNRMSMIHLSRGSVEEKQERLRFGAHGRFGGCRAGFCVNERVAKSKNEYIRRYGSYGHPFCTERTYTIVFRARYVGYVILPFMSKQIFVVRYHSHAGIALKSELCDPNEARAI